VKNTTNYRTGALARAAALCFAGAAALGVFVWFKLRLVTNVPRSAYADPERAAANQQPAPPVPGVRPTPAQSDVTPAAMPAAPASTAPAIVPDQH
jgi:hypothetical protein